MWVRSTHILLTYAKTYQCILYVSNITQMNTKSGIEKVLYGMHMENGVCALNTET